MFMTTMNKFNDSDKNQGDRMADFMAALINL